MTAFTCSFDSIQSDGHAALAAVTGFLSTENAYNDDIELGLAEAINNVIDHAYLSPGPIQLDVCAMKGSVHCILADNGRSYDPKTDIPNIGRGHGWRILQCVSTKCDLVRINGRNQLIIEFTRG